MDELGSLKKKVAAQEKRIKKLEAAVYEDIYEDEKEKRDVSNVSQKVAKIKEKDSGFNFSFNQIITFLGILGISIGVISFFFYAVANGLIGEAAQIGIGVLFGLILFVVAYMLHDKNQNWSNVVFGGAYFIEYLSIGVGVSVYDVMNPVVGVVFGLIVLVSSMVLSIKFSSRMIAYFSLAGGFIIPIITDNFESQIFVMIWYLFILIALAWISISFDWADLRVAMLALIILYAYNSFSRGVGEPMEFVFLFLYFVMFNASSLVSVVSHKKEISILDSSILVSLPIFFLPLVYSMLPSGYDKPFGLTIILFSFVYLLEAFYLKGKDMNFPNAKYSLIAAGVASLNFGIYFLFEEFFHRLDFFIVFFIVEWALFSYLSSISKDLFYKIVGYVFLFLVAIWYFFIVRFSAGVFHASFFLLVIALVPLISFFYFRANFNYKENVALFIVSGYLFLYSFVKYLAFFIHSNSFIQIILSVLWLVYTLGLFLEVESSEGRALVGALLGITLIKIAFKDLFLLEDTFRIVGFILFGVLLLVGGYFLNNAKK